MGAPLPPPSTLQEWSHCGMIQWFDQLPYEGKLGALLLCELINPKHGFNPVGWKILHQLETSISVQPCPETLVHYRELLACMQDESDSADLYGDALQ